MNPDGMKYMTEKELFVKIESRVTYNRDSLISYSLVLCFKGDEKLTVMERPDFNWVEEEYEKVLLAVRTVRV